MKKGFLNLVQIAIWLMAVWLFSNYATPVLYHLAEKSSEPELALSFLKVSFILLFSYIGYYVAHGKSIPTFVSAILLGMAAAVAMEPIIGVHVVLIVVSGLGATYILFGGGYETKLADFRRLFWKILLLATLGVVVSAGLFSLAAYYIAGWLGVEISVRLAVLLGVSLASTDPAAIIPMFKSIVLKNNSIKDIVICESALNDVIGAMLTITAVSTMTGGVEMGSVTDSYRHILGPDSLSVLFKQTVFGLLAGVGGYLLLKVFSWHKKGHDFEAGADGAFFVFIPPFAFVMAMVFGGSGYLAVFIAGLLFHAPHHISRTEKFFDHHIIEGYAKPTIFMFLGALVGADFAGLMKYAPIGLLLAAVFILIIRPITVLFSIGWSMKLGKERLTWKELIFIASVRETGVIPAVLLVGIMALKIPGTEALASIGTWVILPSLIILPLIKPQLAKKLDLLAEPADDRAHTDSTLVPEAVTAS